MRFTFFVLSASLVSACLWLPVSRSPAIITSEADLSSSEGLLETKIPSSLADQDQEIILINPSEATSEPAFEITSEALPTPNPWDGKSRITILVMGLDYADWESTDRTGPPRSDTMILLTLDPQTLQAGMLSIPRDLWVTIPGITEPNKINTAYRFGELYEYPGGGPGLAMRTVETLLGVPINYYAVIDFYAFEDFIDELGGIQVDVPSEIKVDPIGPNNTVILQPGLQTLDGTTALAYARNRSTAGDEEDRASRQQQVILAIRQRVLSLDMLPRLVFRAPSLYAQLSAGIRTNLPLEDAIRLAWLAQDISVEDIQRATIGNGEVIFDYSPDGQAIFIPIPARIQVVRDEIFPSSDPASLGGLTTKEIIAAENSRITIINQSGDLSKGDTVAAFLQEQGLTVLQVDQSDEIRAQTRLVDQVGDPYTMRLLISLLQINPGEVYIQYDFDSGSEFVIYLGSDCCSGFMDKLSSSTLPASTSNPFIPEQHCCSSSSEGKVKPLL